MVNHKQGTKRLTFNNAEAKILQLLDENCFSYENKTPFLKW